jgi:L-ribulose-5-phosphate 3-epimerase
MNMKSNSLSERLAVCSWSLQPASPADLVAKLESTGIRRVQLALDPLRHSPAVWGETAALFRQKGITTVSGMFGCVGEDYSTLETIRATGGLAPDATWEQNWTNIRATAALAQQLGLKLVTFHAGFCRTRRRTRTSPRCCGGWPRRRMYSRPRILGWD